MQRMSSANGIRRSKRCLAAVIGLFLLAGCAQGSGGEAVDFTASLNGTDISTSTPGDPIPLLDDESAELQLSMTNVSDEPVTVNYVRFEGEVLDMIFLTYDTAVRVDLEPGESTNLPPILLDFFDLGGQASGFLRGHVQLFDEERETLGSEAMFLDARGGGSLATLTLFNLLLLGATLLGLGWNLLRLSQRRLPANRFVRGLRVMAVGAGAGLTLAVAFSTLRLWPLPTLTWILFTVIGGLIGYGVGMLLSGADDALVDILDEQDVVDAVMDERLEMVDEEEIETFDVDADDDVLDARETVRTTQRTKARPANTTKSRRTVIDD